MAVMHKNICFKWSTYQYLCLSVIGWLPNASTVSLTWRATTLQTRAAQPFDSIFVSSRTVEILGAFLNASYPLGHISGELSSQEHVSQRTPKGGRLRRPRTKNLGPRIQTCQVFQCRPPVGLGHVCGGEGPLEPLDRSRLL